MSFSLFFFFFVAFIYLRSDPGEVCVCVCIGLYRADWAIVTLGGCN